MEKSKFPYQAKLIVTNVLGTWIGNVLTIDSEEKENQVMGLITAPLEYLSLNIGNSLVPDDIVVFRKDILDNSIITFRKVS